MGIRDDVRVAYHVSIKTSTAAIYIRFVSSWLLTLAGDLAKWTAHQYCLLEENKIPLGCITGNIVIERRCAALPYVERVRSSCIFDRRQAGICPHLGRSTDIQVYTDLPKFSSFAWDKQFYPNLQFS